MADPRQYSIDDPAVRARILGGALGGRPPSAPDPNAASDAEIAAMEARGPAVGVYNRGAQMIGFSDVPTGDVTLRPAPAVPGNGVNPGGLDGPLGDAPPAAPAAPSNKTPVPSSTGSPAAAPPPGAGTQPSAASPSGGLFTPLQTSSPASKYDADLRIAHDMSRLLGQMGLAQEAGAFRNQYYTLQAQRYGDVADTVSRQFGTSGDPSSFAAMYNHMVPNGKKLTGYRYDRATQRFIFQTESGEESPPLSRSDILEATAAFKSPDLISKMMLLRQKAAADQARAANTAHITGQYGMAREDMKAQAAALLQRQIAGDKRAENNRKTTFKFRALGPGQGDVLVVERGGRFFEFKPDANAKLGGGGQLMEIKMDPAAFAAMEDAPPPAAGNPATGGVAPFWKMN